ncbi:TrmB family transcriptional regulator [Bacillus sonorensis]|uniref:TrmB family transcriptional regulator n=1 Tax=Bacillus sonorensis TaxID=119858 RepID=UPI0028533866|nr:helix-turn-helix domain-containing protein [Bacillus sonorensis]MDR4956814.1 helix-turn-helix domain-containing protein [Bacillus sonorensis]
MMEELKKLGLSDLEARCYMTLHEQPDMTGYEVAKRVSTSRSNVYAALRALVDKGICRVTKGDTDKYAAVPIRQVVKYLQREFEKTSSVLVDKLNTPPEPAPSFYHWEGEKHLNTAIKRMIANAETTLVVDIWAENLHKVEDELLAAEQRGVTVIVITLGECETPLQHVFVHRRKDLEKSWPRYGAKKVSVLADSRNAIVCSLDGLLKPSGVETNHPSVIELLKNAFFDDLVMMHIEKDFGDKIAEKYGKDYEQLMDYYAKEKGWDI